MHDQYDAQMWIDHHDQFSKWIGHTARDAAGAVRRAFADLPGATAQLLATAVAVSLTVLTFTASAA